MKVRHLMVSAMAVAVVAITAFAANEVKLDGIKCVMNPKAAAKAANSVDYKEGKVYFCCGNCPKKFDAEKNAVAANFQLAATKQAKQEKCPLSGQATKDEQKVTIDGVDVTFCCGNCKGKIEKEKPEDQKAKVFSNAAFDKAYKVGKQEKAS